MDEVPIEGINCFEKYCNKLMSFNLKNKKIKYMRLAFSSASSENPECAEKNRRLKDFLEFKLLYSIGFIFYRGLYHSRLGDFFIFYYFYSLQYIFFESLFQEDSIQNMIFA